MLKNGIELISYSVDSVKEAKDFKLSLEQAARKLRYACFYDAINSGKADKIATAHHQRDNAETVLFNVFRGTGIKGVAGIEENYENRIIRPFLSVKKEEIDEFVKENGVPFITDETNFSTDYTRNYIRLNVLPEIRKIFPEAESAIYRLSETAKEEDAFLNKLALNTLIKEDGVIKIPLKTEKALFYRACVIAFKALGMEKDYEKTHLDAVYGLKNKKTSAFISLPKGVNAVREYDNAVIFKTEKGEKKETTVKTGEFPLTNGVLKIETALKAANLKDGFYVDADKIKGAVIRNAEKGDVFYKFGGGSKKLADIFTDKKVPLRLRSTLPVIAENKKVLFAAFIGISELVKVDDDTKTIYKITYIND